MLEAPSACARMDALCEFIEFWLGSRNDEYGEPLSEVNARALPMPLRRLYKFAGRWPGFDNRYDSPWAVGAFSTQDALTPLAKLAVSESGRLSFLSENQGNWVCRTNSDGDDPPVWCDGDFCDAQGEFSRGERIVCDSLSRFLVTFVLQEITLGSRCSLFDQGLSASFEANKSEAIPVWLKGPYVDGTDADFFLWRNALVANLWEASVSEPITPLESNSDDASRASCGDQLDGWPLLATRHTERRFSKGSLPRRGR